MVSPLVQFSLQFFQTDRFAPSCLFLSTLQGGQFGRAQGFRIHFSLVNQQLYQLLDNNSLLFRKEVHKALEIIVNLTHVATSTQDGLLISVALSVTLNPSISLTPMPVI